MRLSKRSFIALAGSLLVVLVFAVALFAPRGGAPNTAAGNADLVAVRRGTLVATVNATGAISPRRLAEMAFGASGPITRLTVAQGDRVQAGQVLAQLDSRALDNRLAQAEANLVAAQAKLDQFTDPAPADIAAAQSALTSAEAALAQLKTPTQNDITIAKADVDKAKAALDRAQADYDRIGGASNPFIGMSQQSMALQQAYTDYNRALAAYNSKITPTDSQLKQAQSNVDKARAELARLSSPNLNELKGAQANVDQMRAARDAAKAQIDDAILRAPFDGQVTHVEFDQGSFAQAGRTVLGVADDSELRVKLNIDETDIAQVKQGQATTIGLDAYPDVSLDGRVTDVAASATTTQGVVNYVVTVTIHRGAVPIKIGMTANANIVVAEKDNVLLIPNRAIRAANARRFVTIQNPDGQTQEIEVTLGAANDQETEVLSGVNEGNQVLISTAPPNPINGGPFGR